MLYLINYGSNTLIITTGEFQELKSEQNLQRKLIKLVKETQHFPTNILSPSFFMIHDAS